MPEGALMRGGSSFCSQLIVPPISASSCGSLANRVERGANAGEPTPGARGRLVRRSGFDFLDDAAADHHGVGVRRDRLRAGSVANAEADADRQCDVLAHGGELARNFARIKMPRTGYAFQ